MKQYYSKSQSDSQLNKKDIQTRDAELFPGGQMFSVPPDFFDSERARLRLLLAEASQQKLRVAVRRKILRWGALSAAACLIVAVAISLTFSLNPADNNIPLAEKTVAVTSQHHVELADNASVVYDSEWTQSDEVESADVLLWLY